MLQAPSQPLKLEKLSKILFTLTLKSGKIRPENPEKWQYFAENDPENPEIGMRKWLGTLCGILPPL